MSDDEETRVVSVSYSHMVQPTCYIVGDSFVDPKPEAIDKRKWSDTAPKWRVATKGLNLEGTCTNSYCSAGNKSRIICQWGYSNFDFFDDEHKCKCPLCDQYVQPITCGFYDTKWKITGYKKVAGSHPEAVNGSWNTAANDGYTTFDDDLTTTVQWKELKIEIKKP